MASTNRCRRETSPPSELSPGGIEGDDFRIYAKGTKHRLRVPIKTLPDGKTAVTIERRVWKEERILWMDRREDLPTRD